jgi:nucleoside-diphosphate-sugar epimerase
VAAPLDVLLVSGSGFIGGHVARGLVAAGHRVTVLSRGRQAPPAGATPLPADRTDAGAMAAALGGRRFDLTVDFLVYDAPDLAWVEHVSADALGRYVMISTGQVYLVTEGVSPPYREGDSAGALKAEPAAAAPDHGQWSYGAGKRRAERALFALGERGVRFVALRLPTMQGEGDGSLRLWAYLERMLDGGPVVLPDAGRRPSRFLYAGDLAPVLERMAGAASLAPAYNLAQPDTHSLREFLERVARAAGVTPRFVEVSWEEYRAAGLEPELLPYAGPWASVLDPALAVTELGFAGTAVDAYLPRVVGWHLEHRPDRSHEGYTQRPRELDLAARRVAG